MTKWDIDVQSAAQTLEQATTEAARYEDVGTSLETGLTECVEALPNSPFVVMCVADFAEKVVSPEVSKIVGHTMSAIEGTAEAVNHYVEGDLTMAAAAQRSASDAEVTPPPGAENGG